MQTACDIVYDLPTTNSRSKNSLCNLVICVLVILILYNTISQPYIPYTHDLPKMVSSMAASIGLVSGEEDDGLQSEGDKLSKADAKNSKEDPEAYKTQSEEEKKELTEKVAKVIKNATNIIVMVWAPWCPHCHGAMGPFEEASKMCPETKFLMINSEAVDKDMFRGDDAVVPITHFPFICRMEDGKTVKVFNDEPTSENIVKDMVPEKTEEEPATVEEEPTSTEETETSENTETNPLDELFR
tara:strand:+ start:484 stop:1209 length:726 start_codon:yes stop_codon:yes gene_type:complete